MSRRRLREGHPDTTASKNRLRTTSIEQRLTRRRENRVTTAVLLAAGVGKRLLPLTRDTPKCLVKVNGESILDRLLGSLAQHGFTEIVVVVGHLEERIRQHLATNAHGFAVRFVVNPRYATTNNIYSLWLARHAIRAPFLLIESDLVFDPELLSGLLVPDRIAVAKLHPSMSGSTVQLDPAGRVTAFSVGSVQAPDPAAYKTVNIYSISSVTWQHAVSRLVERVASDRVHDYYEAVFAELVAAGSVQFEGVSFDAGRWIEIDSLDDLRTAEHLFRDPDGGARRRPIPFSAGNE